MKRSILILQHTKREESIAAADRASAELTELGLNVVGPDWESDVELVLVLGGDGTILSAAAEARRRDVPLIGINTGHIGFLAEMEVSDLTEVARRIAAADYRVENRSTLDVTMTFPDGTVRHDWALNEAALMHTDNAHPAHIGVGVDGQGVSTYGADGLLLSTATGSTAYSFSAGGPVLWPDVDAFLVVPIAAHGLFTRPMVVGPPSSVQVSVLDEQKTPMEAWFDGQRRYELPIGTTIVAKKGVKPVRLARMSNAPFSGRLVAKFHLPVQGWRVGERK